MMRVFCVVQHYTTKYTASHIRALEGYTFNPVIAQLFVDTHPEADYEIQVFEGDYEYMLYDQIREEFGYEVKSDLDMELNMYTSYDNQFHIIETKDKLQMILYEIGTFEKVVLDSFESYLQISKILDYMKDNMLRRMMSYIAKNYFRDQAMWVSRLDDAYILEIDEYPLDIVTTLVQNQHVTPIEYINKETS